MSTVDGACHMKQLLCRHKMAWHYREDMYRLLTFLQIGELLLAYSHLGLQLCLSSLSIISKYVYRCNEHAQYKQDCSQDDVPIH